MLRSHRQIRMQIHQLLDACLFALAFWLAHLLRTDVAFTNFIGLTPAEISFDSYVWMYLILLPAAPLILEALA